MTSLGAYPLFGDVSLIYSEQSDVDGNTMRKFRVKIKVANNVSVRDLKPTKVARQLKQDPMSDKVKINESGEFVPASNEQTSSDGQSKE